MMIRKSAKIELLLISICFYFASTAQNKSPITFTGNYSNKNNLDDIKLVVENKSSEKTFYYSIVLEGYNDTTWVPLLSDINSLGINEFLALKPLKPKNKAVKNVSKNKIFRLYKYYKIRFGVMYYEKQDLKSKGEIIYLPPIEE